MCARVYVCMLVRLCDFMFVCEYVSTRVCEYVFEMFLGVVCVVCGGTVEG